MYLFQLWLTLLFILEVVSLVLPSTQNLFRERRTWSTYSPRIMSLSDDDDCGQMLGGLTFLKTKDRKSLVGFYQQNIGMKVWLEQPNITVLSFGNLLLGWHQTDNGPPEVDGCYTFVYPTKQQVDNVYQVFLKDDSTKTSIDGPPRINERYQIYQFFAKDPEGRTLEFQAFLHPLSVVSSQVPKT